MKKSDIFYILLLFVFIGCSTKTTKVDESNTQKSSIKYATGFDIVNENGVKKLIIKSPYQNASETFEYIIKRKIDSKIDSLSKSLISIPIEKIVVTSTTHIPMLELLNEESSIVGFPFSRYVSSKKTRILIDEGKITEIGKEGSLNTEILLELEPELIVGYSVASADKSLSTIQKAGISVIYNGDWLEETPLGRAEWIKFFGVLFDKEKEADSIFKNIENEYLNAKKLALSSTKKPSVFSGAIMSNDIWNLPAGESFVAQFLKDANMNYLWKNSSGKGSLSLSFESVFEKANNADIWIAPGYFSSKEQMVNSNALYKKFDAFTKGSIYTPSTKKGETGGIIYYELASTRPDLVLKDLIKIAHPQLMQDYNFTFFEVMK